LPVRAFISIERKNNRIDLLPVRAFILIEQKNNRTDLLPVRVFISFPLICFPYGEEEAGGTRFSIDMISLTGNA
jgi:hypothetical protein